MKKLLLSSIVSTLLMPTKIFATGFIVVIDNDFSEYEVFDTSMSQSAITFNNDTIEEGNSNFSFAIPLLNGSDINKNASIDYVIQHISTSNNDLVRKNGTHYFKNGNQLFVDIKSDNINEDDQQFKIILSNPKFIELYETEAIYTIKDDDSVPIISTSSSTHSVAEGNPVALTFSINKPSEKDISFRFNTNNNSATTADYNYQNGTVVIPAGDTSAKITIDTKEDNIDEENESFEIEITSNTNVELSKTVQVITIKDDDELPRLSINDVTIDELDNANNPMKFLLTLSNASSKTVTVKLNVDENTTINGVDYERIDNQLITFLPNEIQKEIIVNSIGEYTAEEEESFVLELSSAMNADISKSKGIGTIKDNDFEYSFDEEPNLGVIEYNIGNGWMPVNIKDSYTKEAMFRYNPTEDEILSFTSDIEIGSFDTNPSTPNHVDGTHSLADWGTGSNKKLVFNDSNFSVSTELKKGNLRFVKKPGSHVGVGLGSSTAGGSLGKNEVVTISLDGDYFNDFKFTADGLGGCFDVANKCETKVDIKAFDSDGNLIKQGGGYRDSGALITSYHFNDLSKARRFELEAIPTNTGGKNGNLSGGNYALLNMVISRKPFDTIKMNVQSGDGTKTVQSTRIELHEDNANTNVMIDAQ